MPGDTAKHDLAVTMEDATSGIYSMFLVDEESTASSLRGVREVMSKHGLFCSLYTDRGSHNFFASEAGGPVSRTVQTQFGRALRQLGIEHIAAWSPQARGRSERVFSTLQDRLPKESELARIDTIEAANRWLSGTYIADNNKLFAIAPEQEGSAFVADTMGAWREILCVQEDWTIGNDNTVKWQRLSLQLPPSRLRPHLIKANVRVHEHPAGELAVYWGPQRRADYNATGIMVQPVPLFAVAEPPWVGITSRDGMQGEGEEALTERQARDRLRPGQDQATVQDMPRRMPGGLPCPGAGTTRPLDWSRCGLSPRVGSRHCRKRRESAIGAALQAMAALDLEEIIAIQPPRGFGRD
jgi:hypothetical protein